MLPRHPRDGTVGCSLFEGNLMPALPSPTQDVAVLDRMTTAELAAGIYQIEFSRRLNALFVASTGGFGPTATPSKVIRLSPTLAVEAEFTLPTKGFSLALDDAAARLYVGNTLDSSITVIDLTTNAIVGTVQLAEPTTDADGKPSYSHHVRELLIDPTRHRLYAPGVSMKDSALYCVDTETLRVAAVIPGLGYAATGIALDATNGQLLVCNMQGQLMTIEPNTPGLTRTIETGGDQLLNLAVDTAGQRIFITDQGHEALAAMWSRDLPGYRQRGTGNQVLVLDMTDGSELARLPTGAGPIDILLAPDEQRLFVTNRAGRSITVFDSSSYALLETIAVPAYPNSLAYDATNRALYVTLKADETAPAGSFDSIVRIAF